MVLKENSLVIVLVGDWNKLYIQPEWITQHVFNKNEVEMEISGRGSDFTISYKSNNVLIPATQSKMLFSATKIDKDTLQYLCLCLNNFVRQAQSAQKISYGYNVDFSDDNGSLLAKVFDSVSDNFNIVRAGYEIDSMRISQVLKRDKRKISIDSGLINNKAAIHFNEHHDGEDAGPSFCIEDINSFFCECKKILRAQGYEIEDDES